MRAFGSTALISVLPTIVLFAIPFEKGQQPIPYRLHNGLLAFASGGLLGDVFLHTIPHLLGGHHDHHEHHDHRHLAADEHEHDHHEHDHEHEHDHDHSHDHEHHDHDHDHHAHGGHGEEVDPHEHGLNIGLFILLGFALFFVFEKLIRTPHSHHEEDAAAKTKKMKSNPDGPSTLSTPTAKLTSGGMLNLAADSLHNFTDGVAIGASFVGGKGLGLAVFLSILAHELPHEIGDFAILVKNGATAREAILLQFCTAIFAFIGTGVGLISTHFEEMNELLLALVSGGKVF